MFALSSGKSLLLAVVLCLSVVAGAFAQSGEQAQIEAWRTTLDETERVLGADALEADDLSTLRRQVDAIRIAARALINTLNPRVEAMQAELGVTPDSAPPAEGEAAGGETDPEAEAPEPPPVAALQEMQDTLSEARVVAVRADDLYNRIVEQRRSLLVSRVLEREVSVFSPVLWVDVVSALPGLAIGLADLVDEWASLLVQRGPALAIAVIAAALALAVALVLPVRRYLLRLTARPPISDVPLVRKAATATWIALVNLALPAVSLGLVVMALQAFQLLPPRIDQILLGLLAGIALGSLIVGMARGLIAPACPTWRLVPLNDEAADRLHLVLAFAAAFFALGIIGRPLLDHVNAPTSILMLWRASLAAIVAGFAILSLRIVSSGLIRSDEEGVSHFPWSLVLPAMWIAAFVCLGAITFGFLQLGSFVATQIVWTATLVALLYLLLILVDAFATSVFAPGTRLGLGLSRSMGLTDLRIEQLGVVLSGILRLMLIAAAFVLMAAPYGIESGEVFGGLNALFTGFTFAGMTLSLSGLLTAILLFAVGMAATRGIQRWLDTRLLPHTRMDAGIRNSVRTGIGYLGVILAAIVAINALGANLSNLAIVAGALSVGIGFGLQSIVNNFVSGLILLAERPIKTGDWIVVGAEQGLVKRINVRATEIQTFDRASVIVPNSDLISGVVKNWMHGDRTGRVGVNVGVSYDADPEEVKALLVTCAQDHPKVLIYPEPFVSFQNFGENALDFTLFCFTADAGSAAGIASDLRYVVFKRLKEKGIGIPFPQRDLNLHVGDLEEIRELVRSILDARTPKTEDGGKAG